MKKPVLPPPAWLLRPLYARGQFSPRLLLVWQAFYVACWLAYRAATAHAQVLSGVLVPAPDLTGLAALFLGAATAGLGMGTYQKVAMDGPVPGPDTQITAGTAPVSADTVNLAPPAS